jgi:DNA-binding NarL/FixJ family response regulator
VTAVEVGAAIERLLVHVFETALDAARLRVRGDVERPSGSAPRDRLALDPDAVGAVLADVAADRGLSRREQDALAALLHGVPRKRLGVVLGVGENTLKTFLRSALKKLKQKNSDDAVWWFRTEIERRYRR